MIRGGVARFHQKCCSHLKCRTRLLCFGSSIITQHMPVCVCACVLLVHRKYFIFCEILAVLPMTLLPRFWPIFLFGKLTHVLKRGVWNAALGHVHGTQTLLEWESLWRENKMPHQVCLQVLDCSLNYSSTWYLQWPVCAAKNIMQYSYTDFCAIFIFLGYNFTRIWTKDIFGLFILGLVFMTEWMMFYGLVEKLHNISMYLFIISMLSCFLVCASGLFLKNLFKKIYFVLNFDFILGCF